MSEPYVGEIRIAGFNFAPYGWAFCDGSAIPIDENTTLFTLIGTTYGGDGVNTFNIPDLRGRVPIHQGTNLGMQFVMGQTAGTETVTLAANQLASHSHPFEANTAVATSPNPAAKVPAATQTVPIYTTPSSPVTMSSVSTSTGGGQSHSNIQPMLVINFIISLYGVFPSQN